MPMQRILPLVAIAFLAGNLHAAQVTNVIDEFTTSQSIATNNASLTNTVAASNAIGGFRTMGLTTAGGNTNESTSIFVSAGTQRLTLNTPVESSADFQLKWGGANGNAGLGADFGAGQPLDLSTSILSFALRGTDLTSNFTWQFTDIGGNTASYAGSFSPHSSTNPALLYNISLNLFANAGAVNWNAINYIIFSGGGVEDLDMTINAPFKVVASTVPEPGTWALAASGILTLIAATHRRFRRCR